MKEGKRKGLEGLVEAAGLGVAQEAKAWVSAVTRTDVPLCTLVTGGGGGGRGKCLVKCCICEDDHSVRLPALEKQKPWWNYLF